MKTQKSLFGLFLNILKAKEYNRLNHQYKFISFQNQCDWKNIASYIPGATEDSCMFKILSLKKVRLSEQKWT